MADILSDISSIEERLKQAGLEPEAIAKAVDVIDGYIELRDKLVKNRDAQFHDDAYDVAIEMKAATGKNADLLSAYLRKFAEHVAFATLALSKQFNLVADIVDHIPLLKGDEDDK